MTYGAVLRGGIRNTRIILNYEVQKLIYGVKDKDNLDVKGSATVLLSNSLTKEWG